MEHVYREEILEHYRHPSHFGKLQTYTVKSHQTNPFCGDDIEIFLQTEKGKVTDISFQGVGCAICIASTSILTEYVLGKQLTELTKMKEGDMLALLQMDISQSRKKCALLGFATCKDCIYAAQSKS